MASRFLHRVDNVERIIKDCFKKHGQRLGAEKAQKLKEIDDWEANLIGRVKAHASEQRQDAKFEFDCQLRSCENKQRAFLETLACHERNGNWNQIQQLLEDCRALKFELSVLVYPEQGIPFIQPIPPKTNTIKSDTHQIGVNLPPPGQVHFNQNHTVSSPQATLIRVQQYDRDAGETPTAMINTNNKNGEQYHDDNDDDSNTNKCPTCFMIFSPSMSSSERHRHANEHFENT